MKNIIDAYFPIKQIIKNEHGVKLESVYGKIKKEKKLKMPKPKKIDRFEIVNPVMNWAKVSKTLAKIVENATKLGVPVSEFCDSIDVEQGPGGGSVKATIYCTIDVYGRNKFSSLFDGVNLYKEEQLVK